MKPAALVGIILLIIGIAGFAVGNMSFTTKEKVIDVGPVEVTADKKHNIAFPDVASGLAVAAGIILLVVGMRKA
jgi:hypothetical protein